MIRFCLSMAESVSHRQRIAPSPRGRGALSNKLNALTNSGAGRISRKSAGSCLAIRRSVKSAKDTSCRARPCISCRNMVDLPTCRGPISIKQAYSLLTSTIFLFHYAVNIGYVTLLGQNTIQSYCGRRGLKVNRKICICKIYLCALVYELASRWSSCHLWG